MSVQEPRKDVIFGFFKPLMQADVDRVRAYATVFQAKTEQEINGGEVFNAFAPIAYRTSLDEGKAADDPCVNNDYYKVVVYVGEPARFVMMTVKWDFCNFVPVLTGVEWLSIPDQHAKKNIFTVLKSL
ncbi:hypothetical protein Bbelb_284160 [Branchiostoma belcheri]|nr:hypothetical protein Bbelb_284160 [Branchiostoma belcheri]